MTLAARPVLLAAILSLGAAVSLGITRFAYGLLLPIMRDDLAWTYTLAGAMNTANAVGYLLGALTAPMLLRRQGPARLMLWGAVFATLFMAASGFFSRAPASAVAAPVGGGGQCLGVCDGRAFGGAPGLATS